MCLELAKLKQEFEKNCFKYCKCFEKCLLEIKQKEKPLTNGVIFFMENILNTKNKP